MSEALEILINLADSSPPGPPGIKDGNIRVSMGLTHQVSTRVSEKNRQLIAVTSPVTIKYLDLIPLPVLRILSRARPEDICALSVALSHYECDTVSLSGSLVHRIFSNNYKKHLASVQCVVVNHSYVAGNISETFRKTKRWSKPTHQFIAYVHSLAAAHLAAGWCPAAASPPIKYDLVEVTPVPPGAMARLAQAFCSATSEVQMGELIKGMRLVSHKDTITTHYIRAAHGRYEACDNSFSRISRDTRDIILTGTGYADVDQKRACPTIGTEKLVKDDLITREEQLAYLAISDKEVRTAALYGWQGAGRDIHAEFPVIARVQRGVAEWMKSRHPELKSPAAINKKWAVAVMTTESDIQRDVERMLKSYKVPVVATIYDGCITAVEPTSAVLDSINAYVRQEYEIPLFEIVIKKIWVKEEMTKS